MSTPAKHGTGISGQAGVTLNDWVTVDVTVTPQDSGDIVVDVTCNGRPAIVTFQADGGVDMDVEKSPSG